MITWTNLPLYDQRDRFIADDKLDDAQALVENALRETTRTQGWQVVVMTLRELYADAVEKVAQGDKPEYHAGALQAIAKFHQRLLEILPGAKDTFGEALEEIATEEEIYG
jgi:hypothetical protein